MSYARWREMVFARKWTMLMLRCDERPTEELFALMVEIGLDRWERYVTRLQKEADANLARMAFGADYRQEYR